MQYFGGKARLAPQIVTYLNSIRGSRHFHEPFVGGANIVSNMIGCRFAYDLCQPLITMYNALQTGWVPPIKVSETDYNLLNERRDACDPMTAFAGFGCSFAGKYFGGYARDNTGRNYASNAKNSLMQNGCDYNKSSSKTSNDHKNG